MGIWFVGSIKVRAFSQQALDRVRNLDLDKRFNLPGDFSARGDQLYYKENLNGIFDPEDIVYDFRDILNGEGIVSSTYECGEDGEIAYTYYWLGDGIKVVNFSGCGGVHDIYFDDDEDYDEDDDEYHVDEIYSHAARHAALLHFGIDELRALYDEITEDYEGFEEYVPDDELITALNRYMDANDNEDWACFFDTPHAKKLLEQIKINRGKCRFEDHDFEPNIGWEEKGYVKFTDVEKAYLNANTMEELQAMLEKIKKTKKRVKTGKGKTKQEEEKRKATFVENSRTEKKPIVKGLRWSKVVSAEVADQFFDADHLVIPEGVIEISDCAFCQFSIKSVEFPQSLRMIGKQAFFGCRNLEKIILPEGLEKIGKEAFFCCRSLNDIYVPDSIDIRDLSSCMEHKPMIHISGDLARRLYKENVFVSADCYEVDGHFFKSISEYMDSLPKEQEDYLETTINDRVREEFARQINEKKAELESLSMKEDKIQEEIRLLEEMLGKI